MILLKSLIVCNINGGVKRNKIYLNRVKLKFNNNTDLLKFIVNREKALSKKYGVNIFLHPQTIQ